MKMSPETFKLLEDAIIAAGKLYGYEPRLTTDPISMWDQFHYVCQKQLGYAPFYGADLNDNHIETALRRIMPEVRR